MIYIVLIILSTVFLLSLFKAFPRFGVDVFIAIIVNYLTAAVTGIIFLEHQFSFSEILKADWLKIAAPLGIVFITVFYLISQTAQRINLSTASIANKMSVAIPVLFSVIFLKESLSPLRVAGIVLALIAVYLSTRGDKNNPEHKKLIWLPVLVFFGSGLIDLTINASSAFYIKSNEESALFSIVTFLAAFSCGLITITLLLTNKKRSAEKTFTVRNLIGGIILGVPNYFSIYFLFRALDTQLMSSAQLFTLLNLSTVLLSALVGRIIFKEKLSFINLLGIIVAVGAILLITL